MAIIRKNAIKHLQTAPVWGESFPLESTSVGTHQMRLSLNKTHKNGNIDFMAIHKPTVGNSTQW